MMDYYKCLGLTTEANEKEIKAAYRKLAKKYHPDAIQVHPEWSDKMYEIQAAYEVLGDSEKRKNYDKQRTKQTGRKEKTQETDGKTFNPNMTGFERFFGFQPGKGMETYQGKQKTTKKPEQAMNVDELFATYFGKKK